jgi:hypothetical protein
MDQELLNMSCGALVLIVLSILESLCMYESDDFTLMEVQVDENLTRKTAQVVISTAALFDYRLSSSLLHLSDELRWWMKPRSMTWFSDFLIR